MNKTEKNNGGFVLVSRLLLIIAMLAVIMLIVSLSYADVVGEKNRPPEVGSYIAYTGGDYTGDWVVLRNNEGKIEIISKESVGNITLTGAEGYANAVSILNTKAQEYVNPDYAISGRSVGATEDSIGQIDTNVYPLTFMVSSTQVLPYHDEYYLSDKQLILSSPLLQHTSGRVWMASRYLDTDPSTIYSFNVRSIGANGQAVNSTDSHSLYNVLQDGTYTAGSGTTNGVRPVITLRPDIEIIGGSGLQSDPYRIGVPIEKVAVGSYLQYSAGDYEGDWVVLRNTEGQLEIISKESVGNVTLSGASDYANAVNILNTKARQYIDPNYAVNARSVGASEESIGFIDTTKYPLTYAAADANGMALPYSDGYHIDDKTLIQNIDALKHSSGTVWLASRHLTFVDNVARFAMYNIEASGTVHASYPYGANVNGSSSVTHTLTYGVRPVVTLRADMQIVGGSGTQADPYKLGIYHKSLPVGSYVSYTGGDYAGSWVVLRDTPVGLELISKESVRDLTLSGAYGYAKAVRILNNTAKGYVNSAYAVTGRSVGATANSIQEIDTTANPLTYAAASTAGQSLPYTDAYYTSDQSIISDNANLKHSSGEVWLASRARTISEGSYASFGVRRLGTTGSMQANSYYRANYDTSTVTYEGIYGVRPVILLRPDIAVTGGSGTAGSPYTIGF